MDKNFENKLWENKLETGFTVPENYFEGLTEGIQTRMRVERLREMVPEDGFSVPEGYFDQLNARIMARKEPKVVSLWHSNLLKYASAACFILVTAFGLYLNQQNYTTESATADIANEQMLYDIDEQDIIDHVQGNRIEDKVLVPSEAELETYILNNYSQNELSTDL